MTSVERLKFLADKGDECWLGLSNVEAIKDVLNQLELSKNLIIRKNARLEEYAEEQARDEKIINMMADYISNLDIDEDICIKNIASPELCNEEHSNCKECIKEYFYKKVENSAKQ